LSVTFQPLTEHVGVEVRGIDLRQPLAPAEVAAIREVWLRYGVLVFHEQQLALEDQVRFTNTFGELQVNRAGTMLGMDHIHIANVAVNGFDGFLGNGEMMFHQDGVYGPLPPFHTTLFALELPRKGGNTRFASTANAYERLSAELRERLLTYDIHYSYDYTWVTRGAPTAEVPQHTHPLVIADPRTGRPLLFCNRLMADHIVGLTRTESDALIAQLCGTIEASDNVYEHVWRVGDFVAWDNFLTQHARTDFDPQERRVLRRTQSTGATPGAYAR
jgi:alpha-ketoglutarate-dependent taurine dioxygenase